MNNPKNNRNNENKGEIIAYLWGLSITKKILLMLQDELFTCFVCLSSISSTLFASFIFSPTFPENLSKTINEWISFDNNKKNEFMVFRCIIISSVSTSPEVKYDSSANSDYCYSFVRNLSHICLIGLCNKTREGFRRDKNFLKIRSLRNFCLHFI